MKTAVILKTLRNTFWLALASAFGLGSMAVPVRGESELKHMIAIDWRLGPDYPMGIQDSAVGNVGGLVVSAGGFTRHPLDVLKKYPDAFGAAKEGNGFTKLTFVFDPANEKAGWQRIPDLPGPARQGGASAVAADAMYVMGGTNYTDPYTYRDTYQLRRMNSQWSWQLLMSCKLPWPIYGTSGVTAVIGKKIYLTGAGDYFHAPGTPDLEFHSERGRGASPVGAALLVLDTEHLENGWKRLADCPGTSSMNATVAAIAGKVYRLGGLYSPLIAAKGQPQYYNAVDSWVYDPATDAWAQLQDMPLGANRRAMTYCDRYVLMLAGFRYGKTWTVDGTIIAEDDQLGLTPKPKNSLLMGPKHKFQKTVLVYDTVTGHLGLADPLVEPTNYPAATQIGDTIYTLGGEGGPRLYHPATLQIGQIRSVLQ